jgi:hypothetical protein
MSRLPINGRLMDVAMPTTSWFWSDGQRIEQLDELLRAGYTSTHARIPGYDIAGMDATVHASAWFSRFFLSAAAWLRQKIVIESVGQGTRQAARQIQRAHGLAKTPTVRVVELRRSQYVHRESSDATSSGRKLTVRFVVKGFWRNQWYSSRQEHAPKYIESHLRGPSDAPLKAETPTVFMVRR